MSEEKFPVVFCWQAQEVKGHKFNSLRNYSLCNANIIFVTFQEKVTFKYKLQIQVYNFENSFAGLLAEPVKIPVKANVSVEVNQFCLRELLSRK